MTTRALKAIKSKKESTKEMSLAPLSISLGKKSEKSVPLTGKLLAKRLAGLIPRKKADELEHHINESCEQE